MKITNGREGGPTLIRNRGMPPKPRTRGYLSKKPGPHSGPEEVPHFFGWGATLVFQLVTEWVLRHEFHRKIREIGSKRRGIS
jgi:hypothetical protein